MNVETGALLLLMFVTLQRLSELMIARRNTKALMDIGGVEYGASHYPVMVALHAGWLVVLWWLGRGEELQWLWLAAYGVLQVFRLWILATLGRRWTTRIITVPGERLVTAGPFKWLRHPNYVLVALEVPVLPMIFGLWQVALIFAILNLAMLAWRISVEEQALGALR
jgi:methyltransferase